jgi:ring-1,2-phenylacetyl-CoA epoxidase subunit PaaE
VPLNSGRINAEKLIELSQLVNYSLFDHIFICGPEEMLFSVKDFMHEAGIDKKKIHFELFTTPGQQTGPRIIKSASNDSGPQSHITVKVDGRSFDFNIPFSSEITILDAALDKGADLPFACKGGVCCTCKAKLVSGDVTMDVHWGLEEEEVEQGYILACQSHPRSEKVVVDFDIK